MAPPVGREIPQPRSRNVRNPQQCGLSAVDRRTGSAARSPSTAMEAKMAAVPPSPHRATRVETPTVVRASSLMRRTNIRLRQLLLDPFVKNEPIAFFCECRSVTCFSVIWKTGAAFDAIEASQSGWLLSDGHEASARWRPRNPDPDPFPTMATARRSAGRPPQGIGRLSGPSMTGDASSA